LRRALHLLFELGKSIKMTLSRRTTVKNNEMKLYGIPLGPYVRKVAVVLRLKGLAFESVPVMPGSDENPAFKAISPLLKVPAFSDGDLGLADSSVICEYLEDAYPEVAVYPSDPLNKSRARWLEEYADTKVVGVCGPGIFFQRVIKPALMDTPADEAIITANINNDMPPVLDYLEAQVGELMGDRCNGAAEQAFLFGEIGVADIAIATQFLNAHYAGFNVDAKNWPALASYLQRVWAQPVFAEEITQALPAMEDILNKAGLAA